MSGLEPARRCDARYRLGARLPLSVCNHQAATHGVERPLGVDVAECETYRKEKH